MDTRAERDGHRERILDAGYGLGGHGMAHTAARTEVGVGDALGGQRQQQGAHHRVGARIPAGGNDADRLVLLGDGGETLAQVKNLPVDVEAVHGGDALAQQLLRERRHLTGGRAERSHVGVQCVQVVVVMVNASQLHIVGGQNGLFYGLAYVAITYDGDFRLHIFTFLKAAKILFFFWDEKAASHFFHIFAHYYDNILKLCQHTTSTKSFPAAAPTA